MPYLGNDVSGKRYGLDASEQIRKMDRIVRVAGILHGVGGNAHHVVTGFRIGNRFGKKRSFDFLGER